MDVNRDAAVVAEAERLVHAPRGLVWAVLTDINGWSRWNPAVSHATLRGALAGGSEFSWSSGRVPIRSTLQEVRPGEQIAWTGRAAGVGAVHVWNLSDQAGGTLVRTAESFDGLIARVFSRPMRGWLASTLEKALAALESECARRTSQNRPTTR